MDPNDNQDLVAFEELDVTPPLVASSSYSAISKAPEYAAFGNVLERPLLLKTISWSVGTSVNDTLNLDSWFTNTNIASKLAGWSRFRADFKFIIQLSGSPFHYGEVAFKLHPLVKINDTYMNSMGTFGSSSYISGGALSSTQMFANSSMRPGVTMYVGEDKTAEIDWKFTYPTPYLDLVNSYNAYTSKETYLGMQIVSYTNLGIVSGSGPSVNISIWVQASNVELSGPTIPQSGYITIPLLDSVDYVRNYAVVNNSNNGSNNSEYSVISGMSSISISSNITNNNNSSVSQVADSSIQQQSGVVDAAASVTAVVSDAVGVADHTKKYVKAARTISRALKSIGMCVKSEDRPNTTPVSANPTVGLTAVHRSTVAARSSTVAEGLASQRNPNASAIDELDIESLCNREMRLRDITWPIASATGTRLYSFGVTPLLNFTTTETAPGGNLVYTMQYAPMGYISRMFKYWRGDIKFRFRVVASAMHRGKLRFVYNAAGPVDTLPSEGYAVSKILDLAESREIEFLVPFDAAKAYIDFHTEAHNLVNTYHGTGLAYQPHMNGIISVFVMNTLNSPSNVGDVHIVTYISGHNMKFAVPSLPVTGLYDIDSGSYRTFGVMQGPGMLELQSGPIALEEGSSDRTTLEDVIFGERIISLRDLIQRSNYVHTQGNTFKMPTSHTNALMTVQMALSSVPPPPGPFKDARQLTGMLVLTQAETYPANWTHATPYTTFLSYVSGLFLGWKGGIRWEAITGDTSSPNVDVSGTATNNQSNKAFSLVLEPSDLVSNISGNLHVIGGSSTTTTNYATNRLTPGATRLGTHTYSLVQPRSGKGISATKDGSTNIAQLVVHDYSNLIMNPTSYFWNRSGAGASASPPGSTVGTVHKRFAADHGIVLTMSSMASNIVADYFAALPPVDMYAGADQDFRFFHFITVPPVQICVQGYKYPSALT